jgi:hypothetical protein
VRVRLSLPVHARDSVEPQISKHRNIISHTTTAHHPQPVCVIAQQYSSGTFLKLCFTYRQEKSGAHLQRNYYFGLFQFFSKMLNPEIAKLEFVEVCESLVNKQTV